MTSEHKAKSYRPGIYGFEICRVEYKGILKKMEHNHVFTHILFRQVLRQSQVFFSSIIAKPPTSNNNTCLCADV